VFDPKICALDSSCALPAAGALAAAKQFLLSTGILLPPTVIKSILLEINVLLIHSAKTTTAQKMKKSRPTPSTHGYTDSKTLDE